MKWEAVLEQNPATGIWVAEVLGVPGCYTQGETRKEALTNIREAIELLRETEGLSKPTPVEIVAFEA